MRERETSESIHERAAEWVARIDRDDTDDAVRAELETWLAGDERRRGAFFRAEAAWAMLDRASALRSGRRDDAFDPADREFQPSRRRFLWGGGAIAAGIAVAVTGFDFGPPALRIETAIGEIRRVPLSDGSLAAVNTQTSLAVNIEPRVRRVSLAEGEAWFEVAKDRSRPFVVEAGDVRVQAVGTAFAVRRTAQGAEVQVTEGIVEVWRKGDEAGLRRLAAGTRAFVGEAEGPVSVVAERADLDRALAWRAGQLVFDGDTLEQAAAEFNRYNRIRLEIADAALAQEKMIGRFRTNEPDAFARAAAGLLDARVTTHPDRIILSRK